jgi:hypothetical protein
MQVLLEGVMNGFAIAYDLLVPDKSKVRTHTHYIPTTESRKHESSRHIMDLIAAALDVRH